MAEHKEGNLSLQLGLFSFSDSEFLTLSDLGHILGYSFILYSSQGIVC